MRIQLSDHFTYKKLLRFVGAPMAMMVFISIYGVIDGLFVSNFAGKTQFAAINLIMPFLMVLGSLGFMIGTGGTAIVSKTLGEQQKDKANEYFSFLVYFMAISGVVIGTIGEAIIPYVARWLGADDTMLKYCVQYGRIVLIGLPFFMMQNVFQAFFTTAEKPMLGFIVTLIAGVTNIVLDAIFIALLRMGANGAAIGTAVSQTIGGVLPIIYFARKNNSLLRLVKTHFNGKVLLRTCTNGVSEFISNVSGSVVSMVFNFQLMRLAGENGVATYGVLMYVCFIYVAIFIGYSIGTAPIIGYNFGAQNRAELKNVFKKSFIIMGVIGLAMTGLAEAIAVPISKLFVGYDQELTDMTIKAFRIFSFSFVFTGFGIFTSSMFTALNNGLVSGVLSASRTLVFQVASVLLLPLAFGLNGVWISMLVADVLAASFAFILCAANRKNTAIFSPLPIKISALCKLTKTLGGLCKL